MRPEIMPGLKGFINKNRPLNIKAQVTPSHLPGLEDLRQRGG